MKCRLCGAPNVDMGHACSSTQSPPVTAVQDPAESLGLKRSPSRPVAERRWSLEEIEAKAYKLLDLLKTIGNEQTLAQMQAECGSNLGDVIAQANAISKGIESVRPEVPYNALDAHEARRATRTAKPAKMSDIRFRPGGSEALDVRGDVEDEILADENSREGIAEALALRDATMKQVSGGDGYMPSSGAGLRDTMAKLNSSVASGATISDDTLKHTLTLSAIDAYRSSYRAGDKLKAIEMISRFTGLDEREKERARRLRELKDAHQNYKNGHKPTLEELDRRNAETR